MTTNLGALLLLAAALCVVPSASAHAPPSEDLVQVNPNLIVEIHATEGPYGEPCTGLYVDGRQVYVVCAGKGIVTPDPSDCAFYVDIPGVIKQCVPAFV